MKRLLHLALMPSAILASLYADAVLGEVDACKFCASGTLATEGPRR